MKIGFFLDNSNCREIDFSSPQKGNPGVGGTQYMFSLISYYYAKSQNKTEVVLYSPEISKLPNILTSVQADNLYVAIQKAQSDKIDFFICRTPGRKDFYDLVKKTSLKIILWGHNYSSLYELNWMNKCNNVVKYVCVGNQQLQRLVGHPIYKKSTYIFNAVVPDIYEHQIDDNKQKSICYVGSIIETKGFDVCAKIWRRLYDNGYKTYFHIIGSGQLYNKNAILGSYKIASPSFEKKFIHYLTGPDKKLLPEVIFHGVLSHDKKKDIMQSCYLGMPNPTAETETFGISAVEFELLGVPVVVKNRGGYIDTVKNEESGFLCSGERDIYKKCVHLLSMDKDEYLNISRKASLFANSFSIYAVINDWINMIEELSTGKPILNRNKEKVLFFKKICNLYNLIIYRQ